jgi:hypothetical protein
MSKARAKKGRAPVPAGQKIRRLLGVAVAIVTTIVGIAAGLVTFLPRMTIDAVDLVDPSRPWPMHFTIVNTGIIPLTSVQPMLGICELWLGEPRNLPDRCSGPILSRLAPHSWFAKRLGGDKRYTISLDEAFALAPGVKFGGADISIEIRYEPWFLPIERKKEFRFVTRVEGDGKLSWLSRPLDK